MIRKNDNNRRDDGNIIKLGNIVLINLNGEGHLQKGKRPAVIIQNDIGNRFSPTIQVVPISSSQTKKNLPTHVKLPANECGLRFDSVALCEGIRLIQRTDVIAYISTLDSVYMNRIAKACIINMPFLKFINREEMYEMYEST